MIFDEGYWWPRKARYGVIKDSGAIDIFASRTPYFWSGVVLQAGGNVGVYPIRLLDWFDKVLTFELCPSNFTCLRKNIERYGGRIEAKNLALGRGPGKVGVIPHMECGGHHVDQTGLGVEQIAIDSLKLDRLDLLWLDIEGYEVEALYGAEKTVERFRPQIIVEDWPEYYGRYGDEKAIDWLERRGYSRVYRKKADVLYVDKSN